MGRAPCCDKANVKKGPWSPEEDTKLREYIEKYGTGGNWISLPQRAGLKRCGKSCRLRWLNYLRPDIKHGQFSDAEDRVICSLFASIGSRWSIIAAQLPGRTDNDIKNYWNTKLKKKLMGMLVPSPQMQQQPLPPQFSSPFQTSPTYTNTSYLPTKNLTNFQPISSNTFNKTSSLLQPQESLVSPPMHHYQGGKDNFLNFGAEPSCSSSDGSHEYGGGGGGVHGEQIGVESWIELNQKVVLGDGGGWTDQRGNRNGFWGESALECDLEEIKQLVSTNDSNNFFI